VTGGFSALDWSIVGVYMSAMIGVGVYFARRQKTADDYLLAGHRIPVWAAAISMVATSVSAATFLGAPESAYTGNLTYLAQNLAGIIGVLIVAAVFVPAFFRAKAATVYSLIGDRLGPDSAKLTSTMFVLGRFLASGARFYMAAIPVSLIIWGDTNIEHLLIAVALMTIVSIAYTLMGGLSAVIWTEVPQALLFVGAAIVAIVVLAGKMTLPFGDLFTALQQSTAASGANKLTLIDTRWNMSTDFSLWSALFGLTLFNIAVYATDQDLAQRVLSCRSAVKGSQSAILSQVLGIGVALLFLIIGLLLYIYYQRPDLMGAAAPTAAPERSREVFLFFVLTEMSSGVRGLMLAGLFAAAMSSVASSMGAIASTVIADFYRPLRPGATDRHYVNASRISVLIAGVILGGVAAACVVWQDRAPKALLNFAIGVMLFAYTGLLGVFLTAVTTRRGSVISVAAALATGAACVALMQFGPVRFEHEVNGVVVQSRFSLGWQMLFGTAAAFLVCILGKRRSAHAP